MSPFESVMIVVLVIWAAVFFYLYRLDARIKEVEKRLLHAPGLETIDAPEAVIEPQSKA